MEIYNIDGYLISICGGVMDKIKIDENLYMMESQPDQQLYTLGLNTRTVKIYRVDDSGKIIYRYTSNWAKMPLAHGRFWQHQFNEIDFWNRKSQIILNDIFGIDKILYMFGNKNWMVIKTQKTNKIVHIDSLKEYETSLNILHISYDDEILCHKVDQDVIFIDFQHYILTGEEHRFFTFDRDLSDCKISDFYGNKRFRCIEQVGEKQMHRSYKYSKSGFKLCKSGLSCMIPFSQHCIDTYKTELINRFPNPLIDIVIGYIVGKIF